jgi:hypothetical protein
MRVAIAGMIADSGFHDVISRGTDSNVKQVNTLTVGTPTIAVAQVERFTVDTAADGDAFTITVGGHTFTGTSAGTDAEVQRDAILALMAADSAFLALYSAVAQSTDSIDVTALQDGRPYVITETVETISAYSWAQQTANVIGTQFNFTINGHVSLTPADTTVIATERDALLVVLQANTFYASLVVFAAVSTNQISITAFTAGTPFTITFTNANDLGQAGAGTMTLAATTANVTGNPIAFGSGVVDGDADDTTQLPSATGFRFIGVAARDQSEQAIITGVNNYSEGEAVGVFKRGRIWVEVEEAVTPSDDVYLRHTVNGSLDPGGWRTDADSAKADNVSTWVKYVTSASAGELAKIDVNLP